MEKVRNFMIEKHYDLCFLINLTISPIQRMTEVPTITRIQSPKGSGITLNISPPKLTIRICPTKMINKVMSKPGNSSLRNSPFKADSQVLKALALKIFQNCMKTKMVKSNDSSFGVKLPATWLKLKKLTR